MVKNRKLWRARIGNTAGEHSEHFQNGFAEKYGHDFRVISRWEHTSHICSYCGFKGRKLDLSIREWKCFNCGSRHGRVGSGRSIALENAARNILVAGGHTETLNGHGGKYKTTPKVAATCEMSTLRGATARQESPCLTAGEDVNEAGDTDN